MLGLLAKVKKRNIMTKQMENLLKKLLRPGATNKEKNANNALTTEIPPGKNLQQKN